jgi:hypothetical protein
LLLSSGALLVAAFLDLFDNFIDECFEIVR